MGHKKLASALNLKLTPVDVSTFYKDVVKSIVQYRSQNKIVIHDLMNNLLDLMDSGDKVVAQSFFYFVAKYGIQHDPEVFPNPDSFDSSDRFDTGKVEK